MRSIVKVVLVPALVLVGACGGDDKKLDDALRNDLSLASQSYRPMPYVSPMEMGYQGYGYPPGYAPQPYGYGPQPYATAGTYYPQAPQPVAQTRTIRRAPATVYSTGGTAAARTGTRVVKNTKRDAIIGGAAGAAIGAVTSRDKLKGAVIGGIAGAVLGGVIGNNVDVKRIPF